MPYELYYWPEIQGRGEFVRLVLEDVGAAYLDRGRDGTDLPAALAGELAGLAFAVPVLRDGDLVIPQTVAITRFLGERHGLAPASERGRVLAHAIALTVADVVNEVHDTHHPISVEERYEQHRPAAAQRARVFREARLPRFLAYFEGLLGRDRHGDGAYLAGEPSYADLAVFQLVEGLAYAFPNATAKLAIPKLRALRDRIAARLRLAAYLSSDRRILFNEMGIFRRYPELDADS
jgi:glutathione S-transferase